MNTKHIALILALTAAPMAANAQDILEEYRKAKQSMLKDYEDFRAECNAIYLEAVRQAWKEVKGEPAIPRPKWDEVKPGKIDDNDPANGGQKAKAVKSKNGGIFQVKDDYANDEEFKKDRAQPVSPIKEVSAAELSGLLSPATVKSKAGQKATAAKGDKGGSFKYMDFKFYGTDMKVRLDASKPLKCGQFTPYNVADALAKLSTKEYDNLIFDLLALRGDYNLSDWAYYQLARTVAEKYCGANTNESALVTGYVLYQSGYKIRFAFDPGKGRLYPLIAFKRVMYDYGYWEVDGDAYSLIEKDAPDNIAICPAKFPKEKSLSLYIPSEQSFADDQSEPKTFTAKKYPQMSVTVSVNKNLLEFYNNYPVSYDGENNSTMWYTEANAPLAKSIQNQAYPTLKAAIAGKSKADQVKMILNFCQTAFTYGYDEDVWGGDRVFFAEETFYYPYQDCEDRSILFTRLVRDLTGLKCALVHYEGHLSAAVCFGGDEVYGNYYILDQGKFTACDPTYEVATLGMEQPGMENAAIAVMVLD